MLNKVTANISSLGGDMPQTAKNIESKKKAVKKDIRCGNASYGAIAKLHQIDVATVEAWANEIIDNEMKIKPTIENIAKYPIKLQRIDDIENKLNAITEKENMAYDLVIEITYRKKAFYIKANDLENGSFDDIYTKIINSVCNDSSEYEIKKVKI